MVGLTEKEFLVCLSNADLSQFASTRCYFFNNNKKISTLLNPKI